MLELIISAIQAIMQVMAIVFLGVLLSKKGFIDNDKQRWLSKLNLVFFTPCLLYSNIASTISYERLLAFWPIPVFFLTFTTISWTLSQLVMPVFGIDRYYKRFVLACVMFCNTNSLPVAIISSLAFSEAGKILYWGPNDDQDMVSARGISYTLFFGLFCNLVRWSYGYNLLQKKPEDDDTIAIVYSKSFDYGSISDVNDNSRRSSAATVSEEVDLEYDGRSLKRSSSSIMSNNNSESSRLRPEEHEESKPKSWKQHLVSFFVSVDKFMSPPLYAALLALFVGLTPPLKNLMYNRESFFYASITKAIESCGKASVPIVLVCLGAQLKSIRETQQNNTTPFKPVALSIFIRMFLTPLCVIPIVFAFAYFGKQWSELASDPMFIVSMVVVGCTPTAINLSQITQVNGVFEEEMLNVLFWSYGVICIPVCTSVVSLALIMVGQLN